MARGVNFVCPVERSLSPVFIINIVVCRGKCEVKKLSDVIDSLSPFMEKEHCFFFNYGYKPESRYAS